MKEKDNSNVYEVFGEKVDVKNLIYTIKDSLNQLYTNNIRVNIAEDIKFIRVKKSYIKSVIKDILSGICHNYPSKNLVIDIYKTPNSALNILINSDLGKNTKDIINDILLKFVMELHNCEYMIHDDEIMFSVSMLFPDYRLIAENQ